MPLFDHISLQQRLRIFRQCAIVSHFRPGSESRVSRTTVIPFNNQTICIVGIRDNPSDNYNGAGVACHRASSFISILSGAHRQMGWNHRAPLQRSGSAASSHTHAAPQTQPGWGGIQANGGDIMQTSGGDQGIKLDENSSVK